MRVDLEGVDRYLWGMFRVALILLLFTVPAIAWAASGGYASPERPAEYMIYQYPEISLVVRIDAPETEFESKIFGPENALIKSSGVPESRIGPLYQYIAAVDKPRQLMIKITPGRKVERSKIKMELIQLPDRDRNSGAFVQAYSLMSHGTESVHVNDTTTWAMKSYTLRNAAKAFAALGWVEMRLWSEFYSAHFVLHRLSDVLMAIEQSRKIQAEARVAGFEMLELAALILEGDALIAAGTNTSGQVSTGRFEQAQAILNRIVILADQLDLRSEQALALFNDGLIYEQQGQQDEAIRQFQSALDVSLTTDNTELVNDIRSTAATAYETMGSTAGAIEMLDEISSDLSNEEGQELTNNLYEKGRLLNKSYRFPEAAIELAEALRMQQEAAAFSAWGPTGLALAWSYYAMGDVERASNLILESIPRTSQASHRDALIQAYGSLANIFRSRSQFQAMSEYREKQDELIGSKGPRAGFVLESAMDTWEKEGVRSRKVRDLLVRSRQLASAEGNQLTRQQADIYLCLLNIEQSGRGSCTSASIGSSYDALRKSGVPRLALDASLVRSRILRREGRNRESRAAMEDLIDEVLFFRHSLPGVLGAWYWENKADIFQEYMEVTIALSAGAGNKRVDGKSALLALDRIRLIEGNDLAAKNGQVAGKGSTDNLRMLIARCDSAGEPGVTELAARVNGEVSKLKAAYTPAIGPMSPGALDQLVSGLARDESLLTYYFSDSENYALLGTRKGVSLVRLPGRVPFSERLGGLRSRLSEGGTSLISELDAVGRLLLDPVEGALTQRIYLLPAGPLNGFPFDVLRLDGRFLAEKHKVVNLMNLNSANRRGVELPANFRDRVFLAGNPQASQELFNYDVAVSEEITAVTDLFVGPGLQIVQGVALRKDEFLEPGFVGSGLIHLAIPGTIDLAFPDRSWLLMSRASDDSAVEYILPDNIRGLKFQTTLVVLSQTTVVGESQSSFDSRLGFVSDFLGAGAGQVVVAMWSEGDSETTSFVRDFYAELERGRDTTEAFLRTRIKRLEANGESNFRSWAGFQLFIR